MIENERINTRKLIRENFINARDQKRDEHGASFQSLRINRMLITTPTCMQWKLTTPDQFIASPKKFSLKYSFAPKKSTLSSDRIPSFASIFSKLSSQNKAGRYDTSRFLYPVSKVSARNAWDRGWDQAFIFWVSQLKQARLIIHFSYWSRRFDVFLRWKIFFRFICNCLNCNYHCNDHIFI